MTNFADFAETHFADEFEGADEPRLWMDEYEYDFADDLLDLSEPEYDFGGEDAYLDSYWENEAEMAFWDE